MAIVQTFLELTNFASPLKQTIIPCIITAYAIQIAVAIPSIIYQSDRFFDASGLFTFFIINLLSLYLPAIRTKYADNNLGNVADAVKEGAKAVAAGTPLAISYNWRQLALSGAVAIWSVRLGVYLLRRILREGHDHRFTEIRVNPKRYLRAFIGQATWVIFSMLPIMAVNAIPSGVRSVHYTKPTDFSGFALWTFGFILECVADYQKAKWQQEKRDKIHDEKFLTSGLWSVVQFPNYLGETMLWIGLCSAVFGVLICNDVREALTAPDSSPMSVISILFFCTIGPAFVTLLTLKVTGVPYAEKKYNRLYGDDKKYQKWKRETPKFLPIPPKQH
ncbi:hypothetical protein B0T20DRAFT_125815 [Sordaria brevicollis]|uniref:Steroid 5-alpha reductase C-terminal domain-containing protein n=1 Tax=Sordaria brevicollis TaxID=83679 RepID=A0AAE0PLR6_SORBR|nr:hypothetical protein B0T20DRAFT_125815 [Sordaria brevicollis]